MEKIKKTILYLIGSFMAFSFSVLGVSAQMQTKYGIAPQPFYGVASISDSSWWDRIISLILSPLFMVVLIILALILGIIFLIKNRTRKSNKKN